MKEALRATLAAYQPQTIQLEPGRARAAVLLLLYDRKGRTHVVFQKRTEHVETHKGQISFPGGMADPGDSGLAFTALRETHEEIGVHPSDVEVLGQLDDIAILWLAFAALVRLAPPEVVAEHRARTARGGSQPAP